MAADQRLLKGTHESQEQCLAWLGPATHVQHASISLDCPSSLPCLISPPLRVAFVRRQGCIVIQSSGCSKYRRGGLRAQFRAMRSRREGSVFGPRVRKPILLGCSHEAYETAFNVGSSSKTPDRHAGTIVFASLPCGEMEVASAFSSRVFVSSVLSSSVRYYCVSQTYQRILGQSSMFPKTIIVLKPLR